MSSHCVSATVPLYLEASLSQTTLATEIRDMLNKTEASPQEALQRQELHRMYKLQQRLRLQELLTSQRLLEVQGALKLHEMQQGQVLTDVQRMRAINQMHTQRLHGKHPLDPGTALQATGRHFPRKAPGIHSRYPPVGSESEVRSHARDITGVLEPAACPITEWRKAVSQGGTVRSRTLVVARFPKEFTEVDLAKSFDAIAGVLKVLRCRIVHESDTKCYGLVEFVSEEAARQSLQACDRSELVLQDRKGAKWFPSASRARRATAISKKPVADDNALANAAWPQGACFSF